jgi:hypothetical protein
MPNETQNEKFKDDEKFPKMIGTDGNYDYLKIASNPEKGLQLGLKVLWTAVNQNGQPRLAVGFRLRAARIPQDPQSGDPPTGWAFPWEQVDSQRASLVRLLVLERSPEEAVGMLEDLKAIRYGYKVRQFLQEHADVEGWTVAPDDLDDYLMTMIEEGVMALMANFDPRARLKLLHAKKVEFDAWYETQVKAAEDQLKAHNLAEPELKGALTELVSAGEISASVNMLKGLSPKAVNIGHALKEAIKGGEEADPPVDMAEDNQVVLPGDVDTDHDDGEDQDGDYDDA